MIHVAGGTYLEVCTEPAWSELYGSGTRAAAVLAGFSNAVTLSTYISATHSEPLQALGALYGFALAGTIPISATPEFHYAHPLAAPLIFPPLQSLEAVDLHSVQADSALRFGFIQGDAVVTADRVVYDPQARTPARFRDNGSTASHVAIVANAFQFSQMLSTQSQLLANGDILEELDAEVVVIKRGVFGATVITEASTTPIPVYRTRKVWKLGSGDVFSAIFAHYWAEKHAHPVEAAMQASLGTAYYCNTQLLPIRQMPSASNSHVRCPSYFPPAVGSEKTDARIYLAGPFFTMEQRWLIEEARNAIADLGVSVFSPFHDVGFGPALDVATQDLHALTDCHSMLAIVNGLDAGTLFEIGFARARGLPVAVFVQNEADGNLTMLEGSGCRMFQDFTSAIYNASWMALTHVSR